MFKHGQITMATQCGGVTLKIPNAFFKLLNINYNTCNFQRDKRSLEAMISLALIGTREWEFRWGPVS